MTLFPFVQFEFAASPGPEPGRYVAHGGESLDDADVLVVRRRGAPPASGGPLRRRARAVAADGEPGEVTLTTCTIVRAPLRCESAKEAARLLRDLKESPAEQEAWVAAALALLNRAIAAYRVCAVDPYAIDIARTDARAVRIGYGSGERVFAGAWDEAFAVPAPRPPRISRESRLQAQEGIAAVLAGTSRVLESEELILRVMLDLEHRRVRAAAVGLEAALALLGGEIGDEALVLPRVGELAAAAREGDLDDAEVAELRDLTGEVGTVVDGWRYKGVVV